MESYLPISYLNDFVFCPYSIYLHNVYKGGDEDLYHATPQNEGKAAHKSIDEQVAKNFDKDDLIGLEVYSNELNIMGKIDVFKHQTKTLIERKNNLTTIYQGQIWQLQAQYFCMIEMGYSINEIAFYSITDNKIHVLNLPNEEDKIILKITLDKIKDINVLQNVIPNNNKCKHCIYNNLCDKTDIENVYQ